VVPKSEINAYRLLRDKIAHGAHTWFWKNKKKTRLTHKRNPRGYIEIADADGVLVAEVHSDTEDNTYFFVEKFIGRLVAWFQPEMAAINIQFREVSAQPSRRKQKGSRRYRQN
jgi:hypothetical protein